MMTHDVTTHRFEPGTRLLLPLSGAALLLLACSGRTPDTTDQDPGAPGAVHLTTGEAIATFASVGRLVLDDVRGMALAEDGKSVHVLDTHFVHQLDLDGRLLASMGGPGKGPGELEAPIEVKPAAAGGAWVYDPPNGRATRYGPDSSVEDEISGIDHPDAPFVAFGDGILVAVVRKPRVSVTGADGTRGLRNAVYAGEVSGERLLHYYLGSGEMLDVESPPDVPDAFVRDGERGRIVGWRMAAISPNEIAVVIGGSDLSAWRLVLEGDGERIDTIVELPVPADLLRMVRERAALGLGVSAIPITSATVVGERLWVLLAEFDLIPRWDGPLAFSIPLDGSATSLRLDRGAVNAGGQIVDLIVLPDRIVVATRTEVSFLTVPPA